MNFLKTFLNKGELWAYKLAYDQAYEKGLEKGKKDSQIFFEAIIEHNSAISIMGKADILNTSSNTLIFRAFQIKK